MPKERLILFIDAQNLYKGAREAFFEPSDWHFHGQFNPVTLGQLVVSRPPPGRERVVHEVRIYTGRPDATKDPKTYAAHMKQCQAWKKAGAKVFARMLRYPVNWPTMPAQEKGIDVAMAIDFIALAIDGEYDVGVIASTDTDLKPALEFVHKRYGSNRCVEVAAWTSPRSRRRLSIRGAHVWCYWLDRNDYDSIADLTDYAV